MLLFVSCDSSSSESLAFLSVGKGWRKRSGGASRICGALVYSHCASRNPTDVRWYKMHYSLILILLFSIDYFETFRHITETLSNVFSIP
jgi:hypothetical protein